MYDSASLSETPGSAAMTSHPFPAASAALQTKLLGTTLTYLAEVDSTQNVARQAALAGAPEGLVVVADRQSAGRGRLGRDWWSPAEGGLYVSLLLRPRLTPERLAWVTMAVALGAAEGVEAVCGVQPELKWPNDLTWQGRKLAGVLAEAGLVDGQVEYVIAGLGLNVQVDFGQRPELARQAVSLHEITGGPVDRSALLAALLAAIEIHYLAIQRGVSPLPRWAARLATLGQAVDVVQPDGTTLTGLAEAVLEDGRLLLRLPDGSSLPLSAADVSLRRRPADSADNTPPSPPDAHAVA